MFSECFVFFSSVAGLVGLEAVLLFRLLVMLRDAERVVGQCVKARIHGLVPCHTQSPSRHVFHCLRKEDRLQPWISSCHFPTPATGCVAKLADAGVCSTTRTSSRSRGLASATLKSLFIPQMLQTSASVSPLLAKGRFRKLRFFFYARSAEACELQTSAFDDAPLPSFRLQVKREARNEAPSFRAA